MSYGLKPSLSREPNITVVIPCKDDVAVSACIESIDAPAAAVVAFNGSTPQFVAAVMGRHPTATHIVLPKANLSLALEEGIKAAPTDNVLLMDSDCTFEPGSVQAFVDAMSAGDPSREVYKGRVMFRHGHDCLSQVIARSRQHHTAEQLTAYKPPLALSRLLASQLGGHIFNPALIWREDADLDHRIRAAGIAIRSVGDGVIYHGPLTVRGDLRSTFRYGMGEAIADHLGLDLTDVPRSARSTLYSQGVLPAAYMLVRNRVYTAGYCFMRLCQWRAR